MSESRAAIASRSVACPALQTLSRKLSDASICLRKASSDLLFPIRCACPRSLKSADIVLQQLLWASISAIAQDSSLSKISWRCCVLRRIAFLAWVATLICLQTTWGAIVLGTQTWSQIKKMTNKRPEKKCPCSIYQKLSVFLVTCSVFVWTGDINLSSWDVRLDWNNKNAVQEWRHEGNAQAVMWPPQFTRLLWVMFAD